MAIGMDHWKEIKILSYKNINPDNYFRSDFPGEYNNDGTENNQKPV
jgi:hypothetical protein